MLLEISDVRFESGKAHFSVKMHPVSNNTTHFPGLPERLFECFPRLVNHNCHNEFGYTFKQEAQNTAIPHILEHLAIELEREAASSENISYGIMKGETKWDWWCDPRGLFHVWLEYVNKPVAIAAIDVGATIMRLLMQDVRSEIDLAFHMERLRQIIREDPTLPRKSSTVAAVHRLHQYSSPATT